MKFPSKAQFDGGLIIPASAGIGKVLTSDGSGNATWADPAAGAAATAPSTLQANSAGGANVTTTSSVNAWAIVPLPTTIDYQTPGAFTLNGDGTLTINQDGTYTVHCDVTSPTAWTVNGVQMTCGVFLDTLSVDLVRGDSYSVGTGSRPTVSLAGTIQATAGQKLIIAYYGYASGGTIHVNNFSIVREGGAAGSQGNPGTPGRVIPVTSLPASPVDGDEIYFQDANMFSTGILWHLRYRAGIGDSSKWEFLGGAPIVGQTGNTTIFANGAGWKRFPVPLQVPLPLKGVYHVRGQAHLQIGANFGGISMGIGTDTNPTPSPTTMIVTANTPASAGSMVMSVAGTRTFDRVTENYVEITINLNAVTAVTPWWRTMELQPVRVG